MFRFIRKLFNNRQGKYVQTATFERDYKLSSTKYLISSNALTILNQMASETKSYPQFDEDIRPKCEPIVRFILEHLQISENTKYIVMDYETIGESREMLSLTETICLTLQYVCWVGLCMNNEDKIKASIECSAQQLTILFNRHYFHGGYDRGLLEIRRKSNDVFVCLSQRMTDEGN